MPEDGFYDHGTSLPINEPDQFLSGMESVITIDTSIYHIGRNFGMPMVVVPGLFR